MYKNKNDDKPNFDICDDEYLRVRQLKTQKYFKRPTLNEYLSKLKDEKEECERIPTGITELDEILDGGFAPGVYIFGANPGLGKTSLMLHILLNLATMKKYTLLFNLEMSSFQIISKLLSNYSYRLSTDDLEFNKMTINELSSRKFIYGNKDFKTLYSKYVNNVDTYISIITKSEDYTTNYDDRHTNYVERIKVALQNYQAFKITPIVIVDFLQLLKLTPVDDKEIDRRLEMNSIVEKLKHYSNTYNVTIILISSLSRNAYTKEIIDTDDIVYNLSAFKESGMIEYQADFLAVLSKGEKIVDFGGEDKTTINISVLKNRFGAKVDETFSLIFKPEYSYFEEINERKN